MILYTINSATFRRMFFLVLASTLISFGAKAAENSNASFADSTVIIKVHNVQMAINTLIGGRITSFKLGEEELLTGKSVHSNFYGSTLWFSPEGKWRGQGITDNKDYIVNKRSATKLKLTSQKDTLRGFTVTKEFTANKSDTSITVKYAIQNIATKPQSVSAWEVTRVIPGGLAFYPRGDAPTLDKSNLPVKVVDGSVWYPYDPVTGPYQKSFVSGSEGWQAYIRNGVIFIKKFLDVSTAQFAPGEVNVEVYVNPQRTYMEIENQGPLTELPRGQSLTYEVKWYLRKLPPSLKTDVGNLALVAYVRAVLKEKN